MGYRIELGEIEAALNRLDYVSEAAALHSSYVGHHASIGEHCYLASNVVISGGTRIDPYCFLGVNATIGHEITVGRESFIGAGALITKNVDPRSVHILPDTPRHRLDSVTFQRLTKMQ